MPSPSSHLAVLDPSQSAQAPRVAPKLEIPIPGVTLTSVTDPNDYSIPWIGQYVGGVYTFMISIIGLVAACMMIIGGFEYLTSAGDNTKIGKGKKRIADALIGLVLALGSYALLYTINPDLVQFKALQIVAVQTESADFDAPLGTTMVDTGAGTPPDAASGAAAGGNSGPVSFTGSTHEWYTGSCPFSYSPSDNAEGRLAFYKGIQTPGVITGSSRAEKVVQIADLARVCGAYLGSCGRTAGAINALAGIFESSPPWASCCLNEAACKATCSQYAGYQKLHCLEEAGNCNDGSKGRDIFSISQKQRLFLYALRCDNENAVAAANKGKPWPTCSHPGPWTSSDENCTRTDCVTSQVAAIQATAQFLGSSGPPIPDLQPGDRLVVYNGNNDILGAHAIIFMGWSPAGPNVMQTINGTAGMATFWGRSCVRQPCAGAPLFPILYVWRP